ncbi:hypothetical protein [Mucilaginibacter boryungensis]|uniref:Uncharacterized protein n=1 Tax=Mucilaginibacter boryungensis TaxID=768480 RepID=A0ABR9XJX5_9SPHI|nr:hypothetical protein [Mucilaginibacter boryungensis]MBE9667339.1 hypothetical protein [Mucilaginibacter boryungensis]
MITIVNTISMLCLIALPLARKTTQKHDKPVVYKIDTDTTEASYAINSNGYLEEVAENKVKR